MREFFDCSVGGNIGCDGWTLDGDRPDCARAAKYASTQPCQPECAGSAVYSGCFAANQCAMRTAAFVARVAHRPADHAKRRGTLDTRCNHGSHAQDADGPGG